MQFKFDLFTMTIGTFIIISSNTVLDAASNSRQNASQVYYFNKQYPQVFENHTNGLPSYVNNSIKSLFSNSTFSIQLESSTGHKKINASSQPVVDQISSHSCPRVMDCFCGVNKKMNQGEDFQ